MAASAGTADSSGAAAIVDERLLEAAASGNATILKHLVLRDPGVLLGTTPQENTCLHISSIYGHLGFCTDVVVLNRSLLSFVNADGETPLLCATTRGHATLASFFIKCCPDPKLTQAILKQDKEGCNALHHAIRNGHRELALELIAAEPALSAALNHHNESPMFIAVMRNYEDIFEKLLEIPDSAHAGTYGYNALHAAVKSGNSAIAKRIMETRPGLAKEEQNGKSSPIHLAVVWDKTDVLKVLLEHDPSLGYVYNTLGNPLLNSAAYRGHVGVARELLKHCPDAPYRTNKSFTFLHEAVYGDKFDFLEFILDESQQHHMSKKLINMRDSSGKTALHYAVEKCNPRMVRALLQHKDIDLTVLDNNGCDPIWIRPTSSIDAKTLNWGEVSMLLLKYAPAWATHLYNHQKEVKDAVTTKSRENIKSLTERYTSNTSLVAILIATITFAAAFTLPGGYSNDAGSEGLPIMGRKLAFQAFLFADTLAMTSSLLVAFVCVLARWEDLEFLIYYRSFTKKIMWFAYMATTIAFATGLYIVLAPRLLWLAIVICIISVLLPFVTKLLGEWPILNLRYRLGQSFKSEFLDMV